MFPIEDNDTTCSGCSVRNLEDIPDDIMDATKSLILKKESDKENGKSEVFAVLRAQQLQIDRLESQINLLVQLMTKKWEQMKQYYIYVYANKITWCLINSCFISG